MNENEKSKAVVLDLYSLLRDIGRNIWVVILAALIGLLSVTMLNQGLYTPQYTSTATLIANVNNSATYSYTNLTSSSEIAEIFTKVFTQKTLLLNAAEQLGSDTFVGSVRASVLENTNIFTVSVTTTSPMQSYKELCAMLEVYPTFSEAIFSGSVLEIMRYPNLPVSPSNRISSSYQRLATAGCALLALAIIAFLSITRNTVKSEKIFKRDIDAKLFGTVNHESRSKSVKDWVKNKLHPTKSALLVGNALTSFAFSENYQKIATKIEYLHRSEGAKVFLLTSFAENEGKSTVAANIALTLAGRNNRVALLDMDFKKPAIHKIFDIEETKSPDFACLLSGEVSAEDYRFHNFKNSGLSLGINQKRHNDYVNWLYTENATALLNGLRYMEDYDYVIIDTPPLSVAADVTSLLSFADRSLLVVRTDCVYVGDLNDIILSIKQHTDGFIGCILNDVYRGIPGASAIGLGDYVYGYKDYGGGYGKYNRYGKYGAYSKYGKYSKYGSYGKYGAYGLPNLSTSASADSADSAKPESPSSENKNGTDPAPETKK